MPKNWNFSLQTNEKIMEFAIIKLELFACLAEFIEKMG